MSAFCCLQPPGNGSTGQAPLLKNETFSRNTTCMQICVMTNICMFVVFLQKVSCSRRGPDWLDRCKMAADGRMLT